MSAQNVFPMITTSEMAWKTLQAEYFRFCHAVTEYAEAMAQEYGVDLTEPWIPEPIAPDMDVMLWEIEGGQRFPVIIWQNCDDQKVGIAAQSKLDKMKDGEDPEHIYYAAGALSITELGVYLNEM